jgi:monoamine oxidase
LEPLLYIEQDWSQEEFSRGCYFNYCPPGTISECGKFLRKSFGRIHWASSETALENSGYMDGALDAGKLFFL